VALKHGMALLQSALPAAALICCIFSSAFSTTFALRLPPTSLHMTLSPVLVFMFDTLPRYVSSPYRFNVNLITLPAEVLIQIRNKLYAGPWF
jgi:hypothetical protein